MTDDAYYTTDIVTTVRFTLRHFDPLNKEQIMSMVPELINFDYMIDRGDSDIVGISVISDEIEHLNTVVVED